MKFLTRAFKVFKKDTPVSKPDRALVKYIFLDVVGFTRDRNVEAQLDIIKTLNKIVKETITDHSIPDNQLIVLPSGDGLCIALIELTHPYDLSLLLSIDIIDRIAIYNAQMNDTRRNFEVRIGISENVDNLITDFNGMDNVAGSGINMARTIMDNADRGQILIGQNVYETLRDREKYEGEAFKNYIAKTKHGKTFNIFQYIRMGHNGLNVDTPSSFIKKQPQPAEPRLTKFVAYYMANALSNHELFLTLVRNSSFYENVAIVLLFYMAKDSIMISESSPYEEPPLKTTWSQPGCTLQDQYEYYRGQHNTIMYSLYEEIRDNYLHPFYYCFEGDSFDPRYLFINERGKAKLKKEWPEIWGQFFAEP
jgi:class 3 adenylate cyclase